MPTGYAHIFSCRCSQAVRSDGKFSPDAFMKKAKGEQAYILLAASFLLGRYAPPRNVSSRELALWKNSLRWLFGPDFPDKGQKVAERNLSFSIDLWNSRMRFYPPDAFRLFSLPFSVMEEGMPAGRSALMAYAEAEGYREICYFEIQRREQPDWDAFLSALAALYPAPPKKIIAPDGDAAAMIREGFDGIVEAFDGSEGAISRFRYDPSTGIQSRYEWTLRTLHITSFPDDETAYRIIGGILVDQDEEWSRRFGY